MSIPERVNDGPRQGGADLPPGGWLVTLLAGWAPDNSCSQISPVRGSSFLGPMSNLSPPWPFVHGQEYRLTDVHGQATSSTRLSAPPQAWLPFGQHPQKAVTSSRLLVSTPPAFFPPPL